MNTKTAVLENCDKFLSSRNSFAYRVCKSIKDGEFSEVLSSEDLTALLNEGAGKHVKLTNLTASMQPLLKQDIVKVKLIGKGRNRRKYWFPGWLSKKHAESILADTSCLPKKLFSVKLMNAFGKEFKTELRDLKLNFGASGTCTAFLLRKMLEKLIFLAFARNKSSDKLLDGNGEFVSLTKMLSLATQMKVGDRPLLMPKTKSKIEGIKFLGDTSAHNPNTNVEMEEIIPQMPFIIIAFGELSRRS